MRGFVHQIRAGRTPKSLLELVQGKRRNRVLRGIVHQIRAGRTPKRHPNLVQRKRRNRVLRGIVHQVRAGGAPPRKALRRPFAKNNKKRENTRSLRVRSAFVGSSRQSIFPRF